MNVKKIDRLAFIVLAVALGMRSIPTQASKAAGGLKLSRPIETPDFVQLSWTGGVQDATYTIFRSLDGGETWTPLVTGLSGVTGTWFFNSFTLDKNYSYKIQADAQW